MKCYVCGEEYELENIQPFPFYDAYENCKFVEVKKLIYHRQEIPLCNKCLRMAMLMVTMTRHLPLPEDLK